MSRVLLPFHAQRPLARAIAPALGAEVAELAWRRFPDDESLVAIEGDLHGADVAIVAGLHRPDEIAIALRFAADTARELGARSVGLIAPYLAYLRQDRRFEPGQAISARLFARYLEESFEWLVTVDPHLHRIPSLGALFEIPARNVAAAPAVAEWIRSNVPEACLVGPDAESGQWVKVVAELAGLPWQTLEKTRLGDREVSFEPARFPPGRTPVLLDDIASTAHTLIAAMAQLTAAGMPPPVCVVTHAVFADDAYQRLLAAGAARVVSTDTIPHPSNAIEVADLIARAAANQFSPDERDQADPETWFGG